MKFFLTQHPKRNYYISTCFTTNFFEYQNTKILDPFNNFKINFNLSEIDKFESI